MAFTMNDFYNMSVFNFTSRGKEIDPARIRTWNPLIRSQMPYPLGHEAVHGIDYYV